MEFVGCWTPVDKTKLDYSRKLEPVYTELAPYSVNPDTGEFLNKTPFPKLVKTGEIDIDEKIQSYAKDVDLYTILERVALSGDTSLLNQRQASFGDVCNIPDNINDFTVYVDKNIKKLKTLNKDVATEVIKDNLSAADIEKMIKDNIAAQMIKQKEAAAKEDK